FLGAMYMLYLYRRVVFGTITREDLRNIVDLSPREKAVFAPLVVLVLWMGLYPNSFLLPIRASVDHLVQQAGTAIKAQQRAELDTAPAVAFASTVIPAKAGIHPSAVSQTDQWVPA